MTQVRTFIADNHAELDRQINDFLREHRHTNVRFMRMIGDGEANYAVLVAWEETE